MEKNDFKDYLDNAEEIIKMTMTFADMGFSEQEIIVIIKKIITESFKDIINEREISDLLN